MQVAGYKLQVARCKMQDARCRMQVAGCKLQDAFWNATPRRFGRPVTRAALSPRFWSSPYFGRDGAWPPREGIRRSFDFPGKGRLASSRDEEPSSSSPAAGRGPGALPSVPFHFQRFCATPPQAKGVKSLPFAKPNLTIKATSARRKIDKNLLKSSAPCYTYARCRAPARPYSASGPSAGGNPKERRSYASVRNRFHRPP